MKARIAYLSTPAPGVYLLNIQCEGEEGIRQYEISRAHLSNIIIDGASLALREANSSHRVPAASQPENANERATGPQFQPTA